MIFKDDTHIWSLAKLIRGTGWPAWSRSGVTPVLGTSHTYCHGPLHSQNLLARHPTELASCSQRWWFGHWGEKNQMSIRNAWNLNRSEFQWSKPFMTFHYTGCPYNGLVESPHNWVRESPLYTMPLTTRKQRTSNSSPNSKAPMKKFILDQSPGWDPRPIFFVEKSLGA